jgi:hypothetical protein
MATVRIVRFSKAALLRKVDPALFSRFRPRQRCFSARNKILDPPKLLIMNRLCNHDLPVIHSA